MTEAMSTAPASPSPFAGSEWFEPLEEAVRLQVRGFIEEFLQEELEAALGRGRLYERGEAANGHRPGHASWSPPQAPWSCRCHALGCMMGRPSARWKSALLPAYTAAQPSTPRL